MQHADRCRDEEEEIKAFDDLLEEYSHALRGECTVRKKEGLEYDTCRRCEQSERENKIEQTRILLDNEADQRKRRCQQCAEEEDHGKHKYESVRNAFFKRQFDKFRLSITRGKRFEHRNAVIMVERFEQSLRRDVYRTVFAENVFHADAASGGREEIAQHRAHDEQSGEDEDHHVSASAGLFLRFGCGAARTLRRCRVRGDRLRDTGVVDGLRRVCALILRSKGGLHLRDGVASGQFHTYGHAAVGAFDPVLVAVRQICSICRGLKTYFGSAAWASGVHSVLLIGYYTRIL